jgi:hypothetical protein
MARDAVELITDGNLHNKPGVRHTESGGGSMTHSSEPQRGPVAMSLFSRVGYTRRTLFTRIWTKSTRTNHRTQVRIRWHAGELWLMIGWHPSCLAHVSIHSPKEDRLLAVRMRFLHISASRPLWRREIARPGLSPGGVMPSFLEWPCWMTGGVQGSPICNLVFASKRPLTFFGTS